MHYLAHTFVKLEGDLAAARNNNHQLKEDEAAAQRLLLQRQDELQRVRRCRKRAVASVRS